MNTYQEPKPGIRGLALLAIVGAVASLAFIASVRADEYIETVTVVGTKTEREIGEVAGALSIITEEEIDRRMMRDIADLIKYEPGVSVSGTGERGGFRASLSEESAETECLLWWMAFRFLRNLVLDHF